MMKDFSTKSSSDGEMANSELATTVLDMNNYISVILSNLGIALAKLPTNSPARENVDRAMHAAEQLADVSLDLNDRVHADRQVI